MNQYRISSLLVCLASIFCIGVVSAAAQNNELMPEYVGSKVCADCHANETDAWQGSHHQLAWTYPEENTVLGDFGDSTFSHKGINTRFFRRGGDYLVETEGKDGKTTTFTISGVAGIAPLQQYLTDIGDGHVQALDVAWDNEEMRWYHLYPDQDLPHNDGLHWTGPYKNWNARCAECHATGFEKNYNPDSRTYQSTAAEIGVGCEACHGPAEAHVAWAKEPEKDATANWSGLSQKGFTVDMADQHAQTQIQQCAGCHSRRETNFDSSPLPGTPFDDAYRLALLREGLYHPDGSIQDEVYVYGSFLQSKMYQSGVRCSDCHDPHSTELKAQGNAVCTQCHSPAGNVRFPTLNKANYDDPSHHFHTEGSEGAQCKSCHMIERTYMVIDERRDHSFRVPRPDLTSQTNSPNACTDCHADRSPQWAADEIARSHPDQTYRGLHYSQVISRARRNPGSNMPALMELAEDTQKPAIVRATALDLMVGMRDQALLARGAELMKDEDPLVRAAAVSLQRGAAPVERVQRLVPALSDPVRLVRLAAAREFLNAPIARMPPGLQSSFRQAMVEWRSSLTAKADFPETHLVLGGAALVMRNLGAAEAAFREVVELDPQRTDAWSMIVRILAETGKREAAEKAVDEALAINPDDERLKTLKGQF